MPPSPTLTREVRGTNTPTQTPVDPTEATGRNDTIDTATDINQLITQPTPIVGQITGTDDVDFYRLDVNTPDQTLIVTVNTDEEASAYKLTIHTPSRGTFGAGYTVNGKARQSRIPIANDTGTYFIEIQFISGERLPRNQYNLTIRFQEPGQLQ